VQIARVSVSIAALMYVFLCKGCRAPGLVLKIFKYFGSLIAAVALIAVVAELGIGRFMPDAYRGYLFETGNDQARWAVGPFDPALPSKAFNDPVRLSKPENTIRILSVGASGTEGWLSAKAVYNLYGVPWQEQGLSSYSRALEFSMNRIADDTSANVEVINLGIAAYNTSDVLRMLKDAMVLEPDLLVLHVGINETWTGERTDWASYVSNDISYFNSERAYEIFTESKSGWRTLSVGDPFSPLALFGGSAQPIVPEMPGRAPGIEERLQHYRDSLASLNRYLQGQGIPAVIMIPTQNVADFHPFGSMAKPGTEAEQLQELNGMLIEALAATGASAKQKYLEIAAIDDGISEVNFQLAKIFQAEGDGEKALEYFWKANDRDIILKRPPGVFHDVTREFVVENGYPVLDVMGFLAERSEGGHVGNNWVYDDVHPNRPAQVELGNELVRIILDNGMLADANYRADLSKLPALNDYDEWVGLDDESVSELAFLRAVHNHMGFGRLRQRMRWDPAPEKFLDQILAWLSIANETAPSDNSLYFATAINVFLERNEAATSIIARMNCEASPERAAAVHQGLLNFSRQTMGYTKPDLGTELAALLNEKGCVK